MSEIIETKTPRKKGHFFRNLLIIILVVLIGVGAFLYFGIYDEGVRAGTVLRISKKGVVFKTYEGQLNLQAFGAMKGNTPFLETFEFSVERSNAEVVKELEAVALSGERVNLHYIKRYVDIPWRGKTRYFITSVERQVQKPVKQGE